MRPCSLKRLQMYKQRFLKTKDYRKKIFTVFYGYLCRIILQGTMKIIAFYGAVIALIFACCTAKPDLPPEEVARQWQAFIDKNRFDDARLLSTGEALEYINGLAAFSNGDTLEWENNTMLHLECKVFGDSAYCTYHFEDELGEPIPGHLGLKRLKGQWLVSRTFFDDGPPVDNSDQKGDMLFPNDTLDEVLE